MHAEIFRILGARENYLKDYFLINVPIIIHIMTCGAVGSFLADYYFDDLAFRRRKVIFFPLFLWNPALIVKWIPIGKCENKKGISVSHW